MPGPGPPSLPQRPSNHGSLKSETPPLSKGSRQPSNEFVPALDDPQGYSSSSSSDSEDDMTMAKSQAFKRPPPFLSSKANIVYGHESRDGDEDEDEDDESPAFLPALEPEKPAGEGSRVTPVPTDRPSISSRHTAPNPASHPHAPQEKRPPAVHAPVTMATSRAVPAGQVSVHNAGRRTPQQRARGLASPRRATDLPVRSPGHRGSIPSNNSGRPGSDGTPSMGSSFSDLDGGACRPYTPFIWFHSY